MTWQGAIQHGARRLHVGATDDGRCSLWVVRDGAPVVLVRGRVRAMVELVEAELVNGDAADVEILNKWLKRRIAT